MDQTIKAPLIKQKGELKVANDYEKRDNNSYYVDHGSEGTNINRDNDGFLRKQLLKSQSLIVLLTAAMTKTMIVAAAMSMKDGE